MLESARTSLLSWAGALAAAGTVLWAVPESALATTSTEPVCTLVIGFSQTADWYMAPVGRRGDTEDPDAAAIFHGHVDGDRWELLWNGGAGVDRWKDPDYEGWDEPIRFPCVSRSQDPDTVVLTISGPHGEDEAAWAADINETVHVIRDKYPAVRRIALQPVVGPPEGQDQCYFPDGVPVVSVRASWQFKHIVSAIGVVAPEDSELLVGALPRLDSCDQYNDQLGHIGGEGGEVAADKVGRVYRDFDWFGAGQAAGAAPTSSDPAPGPDADNGLPATGGSERWVAGALAPLLLALLGRSLATRPRRT